MDMREHVIALNERRIKINKEQQDLIDKRITENPGEPFSAEDRATIAKMDADIDAISRSEERRVGKECRL